MEWWEKPFLTIKEVATLMEKNPAKIHEYRKADLIHMWRDGSGYKTTPKEFQRFLDSLVEYEIDISTSEKIIMAGRMITEKDPAAPGSCERR